MTAEIVLPQLPVSAIWNINFGEDFNIIDLYSDEELEALARERLSAFIDERCRSLNYLVDLRLGYLEEDTDIALRGLETLTPVINRQKQLKRLKTY